MRWYTFRMSTAELKTKIDNLANAMAAGFNELRQDINEVNQKMNEVDQKVDALRTEVIAIRFDDRRTVSRLERLELKTFGSIQE